MSDTMTDTMSDPGADTRRPLVMICLILGIVLAGLDAAIANIALPTIARELNASDSATVWVVNIYTLATSVCLLPVAALSGSIGVKRVYAFGLTLFTVASLACALSPTLAILVAARLVQGIGGACMAALGPAMIRSIYPQPMLGRAFATIALAVAISAALGPSIGALILSVARWPWLFLVNVPLGLVAVPLFLRVAPASQSHPRKLDFAGVLLSAAALGLVVTGVNGLGGTGRGIAGAELVLGLLCGVLLVWQQASKADPLLPLDLLRIPIFALSVMTSMCSYAAQILAYVSLPFLFQSVMHRSGSATGLLVTPWPLLVAVAAPVAGRLSARFPAAVLSSIGLLVLATGLMLLVLMPDAPADWNVAWRMGVCGIGFGFYQTPNNVTMMTAGPPSRSGAASGMMAVARTLGWSLGTAMVALIFELRGTAGAVTCLEVGAAIALLGAVVSVSRGATGAGGTTGA